MNQGYQSPYPSTQQDMLAQQRAQQASLANNAMITHSNILGSAVSISGTLNASRTIIAMSVETAVNGYIVILNGERFIAHKPSEVTELLTKRIATAHLED